METIKLWKWLSFSSRSFTLDNYCREFDELIIDKEDRGLNAKLAYIYNTWYARYKKFVSTYTGINLDNMLYTSTRTAYQALIFK